MDPDLSSIGRTRPNPKRPVLSLRSDLVQDNMPAMVVPKLYIGSVHAAFNQEELKKQGITHVLNASGLPATFPRSFTYLTIDVRDKDYANILSSIPAANIFIEAGIEAGGVMVHCLGGRSRSAAFISAFLMSSHGLTYEETMIRMKACRPVVNINRGFEKQLRAYSMTGFDVYVAHQVLLRQRIRALHTRRAEHMLARNLSFEIIARNSDASSDEQEDTTHRQSQPSFSSTTMGRSFSIKRRESFMIEAKTPVIRLSRPGSNAMRIIPPLRGLGRTFACATCSAELFTLANVVRLDLDLASVLDVEDVQSETASSVDDVEERLSTDPADEFHRTLSSKSSFGSFRLNREAKPRGIAFTKFDLDNLDDGRQRPIPPPTRVPEGAQFSFDSSSPSWSGPPRSPRGRKHVPSIFDSDNKDEGTNSPRSWMFQDTTEKRDRAFSIISSEPGTPIDLPARDTSVRDDVISPPFRTPPLSPYSQINPTTPVSTTPQQAHSPGRPLSAEKRRWLERMKLLRESDHPRVEQVAQADEEAIQLGISCNDHICLEYLEWMGPLNTILQQDMGDICCSRCAKRIGDWSWLPCSDPLTDSPVFRIERVQVLETSMSLDVTPCQTPRLEEQYSNVSDQLAITDEDTIIPKKT